MNLIQILTKINGIASDNKLSTVWIVGGLARDKVMGRAEKLEDVDLTTGDDNIHYVAKEASIVFRGPNTDYKILDDGHAQLIIDGLKTDFSSNFNIPGVKNMLIKAGLKNPTSMQLELYSRDFTCNALLMSLDLKKIIDPTGLGTQDIKKKLLRTCLPAAITLGYDNKRVARILYLAAKLGFNVDEEIIEWVKENPESLTRGSTAQYVTKKIKAACEHDLKKTVDLISKMNLWEYVPVIDELSPYMVGGLKVSNV